MRASLRHSRQAFEADRQCGEMRKRRALAALLATRAPSRLMTLRVLGETCFPYKRKISALRASAPSRSAAANGGCFQANAAGCGLGRVSFKLQYCSLDSIPRILARGHRRPCRNSQCRAFYPEASRLPKGVIDEVEPACFRGRLQGPACSHLIRSTVVLRSAARAGHDLRGSVVVPASGAANRAARHTTGIKRFLHEAVGCDN